jgi:hypothetical protein
MVISYLSASSDGGASNEAEITTRGGRCGLVNYLVASGNQQNHWIFVADSAEIFPGTNILGECNL